jgi:hypothetical protein
MRRLVSILALALLAVALAGALSYGAVTQGLLRPPIGTLRFGQLTVMSLPPCPTIPGALVGAGRRCGSASPWAVWVIWRDASGERHEWQIIRKVLNGG